MLINRILTVTEKLAHKQMKRRESSAGLSSHATVDNIAHYVVIRGLRDLEGCHQLHHMQGGLTNAGMGAKE